MARQQDAAAQVPSLRKGKKPRIYPPAGRVVGDFMANLRKKAILKREFRGSMSLPAPSPYPPCTLPIKRLEPLMIADMRFERHHRGKRLTLRVLTPPDRVPALAAIAEDETSRAVAIHLCQEPEEFVVPGEETIRKHRVCIVKEPFFRCGMNDTFVVQVDHVSDLFWLESSDERVPLQWRETDERSSHEFRTQGNAAVNDQKWAEAERLYSAAITTADNPNDEHQARLNRSYANLKLGSLENALNDACHEVPGARKSDMDLFRQGRAFYELGQYADALVAYDKLKRDFPENRNVEIEFRRTRARCKERKTGQYAFSRMQEQVSAGNPYMDCASFTAPVEVRPSPGCGQGLFTTRSVKVGDLLLCEKAFAYMHAGSARAQGGPIQKQGDPKPANETSQEWIATIVQYLAHNPSSSKAFLSLHHGDYKLAPETTVDGRPIVDTFLVKAIERINSFQADRTSLGQINQVCGIQDLGQDEEDSTTGGIWIMASYINHDCIGNCFRSWIGDVQIVRAKQDLDAGTELRFPYMSYEPLQGDKERQARKEYLGFQCDCALCREAKAMPTWMLSRRRALLSEALAELKPTGDLAKADRSLSALKELHPGNEALGFAIEARTAYLALYSIYSRKRRFTAAVEALIKGLEVQGFDVTARPPRRRIHRQSRFEIRAWGDMGPQIIRFLLLLMLRYQKLAPELRGTLCEYIKTAFCIIVGEEESFLAKIKAVAQALPPAPTTK